jgi:ubiquinone/menaquinone biosynthesis C-methylase UbiE
MNLERILPRLRCIDCGGPLESAASALRCPGCGRNYPVNQDIPVLVQADSEEQIWEAYFHRLIEKTGDAEAANSYFSLGSFRLVRESVLELSTDINDQDVLDVGCGTGHLSGSLAGGNRLIGVDISLKMLTHAAAKGLLVAQSSGKRLPFADRNFDLVLAINILQSLRQGGPLIQELARVAKPGGRIIVCTPNGQSIAMGIFKIIERKKYRHLGVYTATDLEGYFLAAGCAVETVAFLFYPVGRIRRVSGGQRPGFRNKRLAMSLVVAARRL